MYVCVCMSVYVCMYVCVCMCVCVCVCMCVYIYVCMYVCAHVCVYVCMFLIPQSCPLPYQTNIHLDNWVLKWCGTDPRAGGNNLYGCRDGNNGNTRTNGRILLCLIDFGRAKDTRLEAYSDLLQPCKNGSTTDTGSEVGMEVERGTRTGTGTGGRKIHHDRGRDRDRDRGKNGDSDGVMRKERNFCGRNEVEETKEEDEGEGGGVRGVVVSYTKSCVKNAYSYNVTVEHDGGMYVHCMHVQ